MNTEECLRFLEKHKVYIGWGNWTIIIKRVNKCDSEAIIEPSEVGKQAVVTLPNSFLKKHTDVQKSILLHELVHGRVFIMEKRWEEYRDREQELMVNDVEQLIMNREV
jgi:hypothetical protein